MYIHKGDTVVVITGEYKGSRGRVLRVHRKSNRITVEGVNLIKRHTRPSQRNQQGGIVEREAPIHVSNVLPWCESAARPSRVGVKLLEDGTRVRYYKVNGETLND
ncbi:MAG TPA: 50S ribosomal protein L24 [Candidatus Hydrogenedentes bacterium]|jgi:large subunit ribosomal protein L24|nr:50S ribosomal protein L24 [Candidatus Hydrogenedentota bacterium]